MPRFPLLPLLTRDQLLMQSHGVRLLMPFFHVGRETLGAIFGKEEEVLRELRILTMGFNHVELLLEAENGLQKLVGDRLAEDIIEGWHTAFEQQKNRYRVTHQRVTGVHSLAMN